MQVAKMERGGSMSNREKLVQLSGWELPPDSELCGYLLRKLQDNAVAFALEPRMNELSSDLWTANYQEFKDEDTVSDTPEDALCLLAIKLFEEKIL